MRFSKYIVVAVVLLVMVLLVRKSSLFQGSHSTNTAEPEHQLQQNKNHMAETNTQKKINQELAFEENEAFNTLDFISPETKEPSSQQELIMQEISTRVFSEDAFVELFSLQGISKFCSDSERIAEWFNTRYGHFTKQQQSIMDGVKAKCRKHTSSYPNVSGLSRNQITEQYAASSYLGELIQQRKNSNQQSDLEKSQLEKKILLAAIHAENSYIAIESSFTYRFGGQVTNDAESVIEGQDRYYLSQISQLAITNLACGFDAVQMCESDGYLMVIVCAQYPESCGLDYPTWYQQNTLPGMRNDVEAMMGFFSSIPH